MNKHSISTFVRYQLASTVATFLDFAVTVILTEAASIWYLISTSAGSLSGGIAGFILGRKWVFNASSFHGGSQALRYLIAWGGSILLNISGVYLLTNFLKFNYLHSKIITVVTVGIFFNYLLQKKFVFSIRGSGR